MIDINRGELGGSEEEPLKSEKEIRLKKLEDFKQELVNMYGMTSYDELLEYIKIQNKMLERMLKDGSLTEEEFKKLTKVSEFIEGIQREEVEIEKLK